jgi:hypothetical protein
MLTIKNVTKLGNRKVFANWVVRNINCHPTQGKYMFDIQCMSPIGVCMDRCTISIDRIFVNALNPKTNKREATYFFNYNGVKTNVCGTADWLADMDNFTAQLEYIITNYHNKQ